MMRYPPQRSKPWLASMMLSSSARLRYGISICIPTATAATSTPTTTPTASHEHIHFSTRSEAAAARQVAAIRGSGPLSVQRFFNIVPQGLNVVERFC
jgi:hypothetical protein